MTESYEYPALIRWEGDAEMTKDILEGFRKQLLAKGSAEGIALAAAIESGQINSTNLNEKLSGVSADFDAYVQSRGYDMIYS